MLYLVGSLFPYHGWGALGATSSYLTSLFPPCPPDHLGGGRAWCRAVRECLAGPQRPGFASSLCHCHPLLPQAGLCPSLALVCPVQHEGIALAAVLKCSFSSKNCGPVPWIHPFLSSSRGARPLCACPSSPLLAAAPLPAYSAHFSFCCPSLNVGCPRPSGELPKRRCREAGGSSLCSMEQSSPTSRGRPWQSPWPISCRKFLVFFPHDWPRTVTLPKGTDDWPEEQLSSSLPGTSP